MTPKGLKVEPRQIRPLFFMFIGPSPRVPKTHSKSSFFGKIGKKVLSNNSLSQLFLSTLVKIDHTMWIYTCAPLRQSLLLLRSKRVCPQGARPCPRPRLPRQRRNLTPPTHTHTHPLIDTNAANPPPRRHPCRLSPRVAAPPGCLAFRNAATNSAFNHRSSSPRLCT